MRTPASIAERTFPPPPPGMWILVFFMMTWKSRDALMNPQFWAEDGVIFFKQQLSSHAFLVFDSYAGYLHAIPRMGAWISSFLRPEKAPLGYNLIALITTTSAISFSAKRLSTYIPWIIVLAAFLLTPTSGEILGTLTNVHWFTQIALAVLCFDRKRPAPPFMIGLRVAAVVAMGLSGPFSIFTLMICTGCLLAAGAMARSSRTDWSDLGKNYLHSRDWIVLGALAVTAIVQSAVVATHPPAPVVNAPVIGSLHDVISLSFIALGELGPIHAFAENVFPSKIWIALTAIMLMAIIRGRISPPHKCIILLLFAMASLDVIMAALLKPTEELRVFWGGDRYFYFFKAVVWLVAWSALAGISTRHSQRTYVTPAILMAMIMVIAGHLETLRRAPFAQLGWHEMVRTLREPGQHVIPINPVPWTISVTTDGEGRMK